MDRTTETQRRPLPSCADVIGFVNGDFEDAPTQAVVNAAALYGQSPLYRQLVDFGASENADLRLAASAYTALQDGYSHVNDVLELDGVPDRELLKCKGMGDLRLGFIREAAEAAGEWSMGTMLETLQSAEHTGSIAYPDGFPEGTAALVAEKLGDAGIRSLSQVPWHLPWDASPEESSLLQAAVSMDMVGRANMNARSKLARFYITKASQAKAESETLRKRNSALEEDAANVKRKSSDLDERERRLDERESMTKDAMDRALALKSRMLALYGSGPANDDAAEAEAAFYPHANPPALAHAEYALSCHVCRTTTYTKDILVWPSASTRQIPQPAFCPCCGALLGARPGEGPAAD